MEEELKDQLVRVLDMTEAELRATLIIILRDSYEFRPGGDPKRIIKESIDAAYNNARRTGVKGWS